MNSRIKQIRKALGLIQTEFGARLGVTGPAIAKIEKGQNQLSDQMKKAIIREFDVNPLYLEEGVEPMFRTLDESLAALSARMIKDGSARAKAFHKIIALLPEEQLATLEDVMRRAVAEIDAQSKANS